MFRRTWSWNQQKANQGKIWALLTRRAWTSFWTITTTGKLEVEGIGVVKWTSKSPQKDEPTDVFNQETLDQLYDVKLMNKMMVYVGKIMESGVYRLINDEKC